MYVAAHRFHFNLVFTRQKPARTDEMYCYIKINSENASIHTTGKRKKK